MLSKSRGNQMEPPGSNSMELQGIFSSLGASCDMTGFQESSLVTFDGLRAIYVTPLTYSSSIPSGRKVADITHILQAV